MSGRRDFARLTLFAGLVLLAAMAPGGSALAADPDLLVHLKLDETSGTLAVDDAGGDDNATVVSGANGPTWTGGRRDGGLRFGGLTSTGTRYARIAWRAGLAAPGGLTVTAWIRGDQWVNALHCVGGRYTGNTYDWRFWVDQQGKNLTLKIGTSAGWQELQAPVTHSGLAIGTWYHVAATWNGATMIVYLNGAPLGTLATAGTLQTSTSTQVIGVGAKSDGTNWADPFFGTIDDFRFYRRALTQAEIRDIMNEAGGVARLRWSESF